MKCSVFPDIIRLRRSEGEPADIQIAKETDMGTIQTKQIRNIVLLGHSGSGKTSLTEAMLYITKTTDRLGTVAAGNTVSDYDPEEVRRGFSLQAAIAPVM